MDNLSIFKLLGSFLDFYNKKKSENGTPSSQSEGGGGFDLTKGLSSLLGGNLSSLFSGNTPSSNEKGNGEGEPFFSPNAKRSEEGSGGFFTPNDKKGESSFPFTPFFSTPNFTSRSNKEGGERRTSQTKTYPDICVTGAPLQEKMLGVMRSHDEFVKRVKKGENVNV